MLSFVKENQSRGHTNPAGREGPCAVRCGAPVCGGLVPQDSTQPPDVWVPLPTPLLRISPRSFSPPRALCRGRPFLPLTDLTPQKHPQPWLRPVRRASLGRRGTVAFGGSCMSGRSHRTAFQAQGVRTRLAGSPQA